MNLRITQRCAEHWRRGRAAAMLHGSVALMLIAITITAHVRDAMRTRDHADPVSMAAQRFARLKESLAAVGRADELAIGFVTDAAIGRNPDTPEFAQLLQLQFLVSPVIVRSGVKERVVAGSFRSLDEARLGAAQLHLKLTQDLGEGVVLFEREGP